jgi:hypothetical protein
MLDRLPQRVIAPETGISRKGSRISGSQQNKTNLISVTVMTVVQPLKILIQKKREQDCPSNSPFEEGENLKRVASHLFIRWPRSFAVCHFGKQSSLTTPSNSLADHFRLDYYPHGPQKASFAMNKFYRQHLPKESRFRKSPHFEKLMLF